MDLGKVNKDVLRLANLGGRLAATTLWLDKFNSVDEFATAVALISLCIVIMAHWALTSDESVSQESITLQTELLVNNLLKCFAFGMDAVENVLGDLGLLRCGSAAEVIEIAVKPIIDLLVDLVIIVADFFAGFSFFHCFGFRCSAVLVSAADVDGIVTNESAVSSEDIS